MLYYLCCFCPGRSFLLSHFLGEPSSIYDKTNPDWAPNENLGMISVGFQRRVNDTNEPTREVKSEEGVNVPVPHLNCLISQL